MCEGGQTVVYDSDTNGVRHLWKLNLKDGGSVQLTNGLGESDAQCSPKGDMVYYRRGTAEGKTKISRMAISGVGEEDLSEIPAVSPPHISPDGRYVLFGTPRKDGTVVAAILSTETGRPEAEYYLPETAESWYEGDWMPDNRSFGVPDMRSGNTNLWALPVFAGGKEKQITHFTADSTDRFSIHVGRKMDCDVEDFL